MACSTVIITQATIDYKAVRTANNPDLFDYGSVRLNYCRDRISNNIAHLASIKYRQIHKAVPADYYSATIKNYSAT